MTFNRALEKLLKEMVKRDASDLFLTAGAIPSMKIRGRLLQVGRQALSPTDVQTLIDSVMPERLSGEFAAQHEANFAFAPDGLSRFRANAFFQRNSPGMVIRQIRAQVPSLEKLGLPAIAGELALEQRGIVFVVGATGSGKSTTLASMIQQRNQFGSGHIVTVEDPIEYLHKHGNCIITQREVGVDTDSFEAALENTLRQAPDCIVIGEIRSKEAMQQAITFAETGHLCLATLHANTANQALERILHFFPKEEHDRVRMDLAMNLKGIIGQQLLPTPTRDQLVLATEILFNSPLVADKIRNGELHEIRSLMARSATIGMQTFDQALFTLYQRGLIRYEEALKHANSINDLRLQIKLAQGIKRTGHSRLETQGFAE